MGREHQHVSRLAGDDDRHPIRKGKLPGVGLSSRSPTLTRPDSMTRRCASGLSVLGKAAPAGTPRVDEMLPRAIQEGEVPARPASGLPRGVTGEVLEGADAAGPQVPRPGRTSAISM